MAMAFVGLGTSTRVEDIDGGNRLTGAPVIIERSVIRADSNILSSIITRSVSEAGGELRIDRLSHQKQIVQHDSKDFHLSGK